MVDDSSALRLRHWNRPVHVGLSVGHPSGTVGSIGPFVKFQDGRIGFLSIAAAIAPIESQSGDYLHQPGPRDVEILTGDSRVAKLMRVVAAQSAQSNTVDTASAVLNEQIESLGNRVPPGFPDAGQPIGAVALPEEISEGDGVAFIGRTSGFSEGTVTEVQLPELRLRGSRGQFRFRGCMAVRGNGGPFSMPGDGGALVFRRSDGRAVGLILGGPGRDDEHSTLGYVLPLQPSLEALQVRLA